MNRKVAITSNIFKELQAELASATNYTKQFEKERDGNFTIGFSTLILVF